MILKRMALAGIVAVLGAGVSACEDGYGYDRVAMGYGPGYYGDYYGDYYGNPYAGGYGYGAYPSYFGWYGDFYYPGTGVYVYDRYRRPYRWNDDQRRYWEGRGGSWRGERRDEWRGFDRDRRDGGWNADRRPDRDWRRNGTPGDAGSTGYTGRRFRSPDATTGGTARTPRSGWRDRGRR